MQRLAVFLGSNFGSRPSFREAAESLGRVLGQRGLGLVYGGARVGLMGVLADAALAAGAEVDGVIPEVLEARELAHQGLTRQHVVPTMHARKAKMAELADAFLALPGGLGTLEELAEAATWTLLGIQHKPIGLLDVEGYYQPLIEFFDRSVELGMLRPAHRQILVVGRELEPLLDELAAWRPSFSAPKTDLSRA